MCGEGARHPTPPIQRTVPHFNLNFIVIVFIKKKLDTWHFVFGKVWYKKYTYIHVSIYLFIK